MLDFELAYSSALFHCFSLAGLAGVTESNLFAGFGRSFQFWEFLAAVAPLVLSVPARPLSHFPVLAFLVYGDSLDSVRFAPWAEFAHLLLHLHSYNREAI